MEPTDANPGISDRYQQVLERIRIAKEKFGRIDDRIRLVVVTKGHSTDAIREVVAAGAVDLGENYVQEALPKLESLAMIQGLTWHMVGHVQRRKAPLVAANFTWVHSLDSLALAQRFDRSAGEAGIRLSVLLEYNVSGEGSKYGWDATGVGDQSAIFREVEAILSLDNLEIRGLMTMAPYSSEPELSRPYFQALRSLSERLQGSFGEKYFRDLSMGMSQDFEIAIEEGATILRIGEAIMGNRPQAGWR